MFFSKKNTLFVVFICDYSALISTETEKARMKLLKADFQTFQISNEKKHQTYYASSLTRSKACNTSCSNAELIKLFPSGSKVLNTLLACSLFVSGLTNLRSSLNKTKISLFLIAFDGVFFLPTYLTDVYLSPKPIRDVLGFYKTSPQCNILNVPLKL